MARTRPAGAGLPQRARSLPTRGDPGSRKEGRRAQLSFTYEAPASTPEPPQPPPVGEKQPPRDRKHPPEPADEAPETPPTEPEPVPVKDPPPEPGSRGP